jgi:hypothetical protein
MSWWNDLSNFMNNHGNTIAGIGGVAGTLSEAKNIRDMGHAQQEYLTNLGNTLNDSSAFQGYGVTSGLGTSKVGVDGSVSGAGLGPDQGMWNNGGAANGMSMIQGAADINGGQSAVDWNSAAQSYATQGNNINPNYGDFGQVARQAADLSMADPSQRQAQIFDQIMAIQSPELNRQQASQMAQEHAMGRGGVMGSQYGGTSGDAAMARARTQAGNEAAFQAMQQADAERKMFGDMASQYGQIGNQNYNIMADRENALNQMGATYGQMGNQANATANDRMGMLGQLGSSLGQLGLNQAELAYMPMSMQMKLLDLGRTNAELAQSGQHTGLGYLSQLGLGGSTANLNAQQIGSQLTGNMYNALLSNAGGATSADGSVSGIGGLLSGGMDLLNSLFGDD